MTITEKLELACSFRINAAVDCEIANVLKPLLDRAHQIVVGDDFFFFLKYLETSIQKSIYCESLHIVAMIIV
jgi:hypothetical protein